jgi:hypothetical protein
VLDEQPVFRGREQPIHVPDYASFVAYG